VNAAITGVGRPCFGLFNNLLKLGHFAFAQLENSEANPLSLHVRRVVAKWKTVRAALVSKGPHHRSVFGSEQQNARECGPLCCHLAVLAAGERDLLFTP
jgi:hypothetical protein